MSEKVHFFTLAAKMAFFAPLAVRFFDFFVFLMGSVQKNANCEGFSHGVQKNDFFDRPV
jgi:hypothetical protein